MVIILLFQAYMYILNAEEYRPEQLLIEKAKMYWARGQREQAFTTLRRGLDDAYPHTDALTQQQRYTYPVERATREHLTKS